MGRVSLKKEVEEPWIIERVAKFMDLLGQREITLMQNLQSVRSKIVWLRGAKQKSAQRTQ